MVTFCWMVLMMKMDGNMEAAIGLADDVNDDGDVACDAGATLL